MFFKFDISPWQSSPQYTRKGALGIKQRTDPSVFVYNILHRVLTADRFDRTYAVKKAFKWLIYLTRTKSFHNSLPSKPSPVRVLNGRTAAGSTLRVGADHSCPYLPTLFIVPGFRWSHRLRTQQGVPFCQRATAFPLPRNESTRFYYW